MDDNVSWLRAVVYVFAISLFIAVVSLGLALLK
jgi:hypothetical protein